MNPFAHLAWAQAVASLGPALSQLAAANMQQQQQELQRAFEAQLQAIALQPAGNATAPIPPVAPTVSNTKQNRVEKAKPAPQKVVMIKTDATKVTANVKPNNDAPKATNSPRTKEDEAAGTMLMGFLSSLRKGYEEALSEREQKKGEAPTTLSGQKRQASDAPQPTKRSRVPVARQTSASTERVETASGTTSYPAESSLEDSDDAEKGKILSSEDKNSSSEDSDKDYSERGSSGERGPPSGERGSVPPRKRMKGKHNGAEFTRKNVAEHNHRMDVMRSQSQQDSSSLTRWPRDERTD